MSNEARHRLRIMLAFAIVYVVWGSTYLAIRIGVSDIPPALFSGVRNSVAGLLLIAIAVLRDRSFPLSGREWLHALILGILLVTLGNGLVTWGEVYVQSNQAALIVTTSALWVAWFGTFGPKGYPLTLRAKIGLVIGFIGVVLMLMPGRHFTFEHFGAQFMILLSALCWGVGVMYSRNVTVTITPLMHSGMLLFVGGALLVIFGLAGGEAAHWQWSVRGLSALVYLTLIGSCLTYTTYVWLINQTTPDKLSTTAYVNPAIALVLGWLVLGETVAGMRLVGMFVILLGVILVTTRYRMQMQRLFWKKVRDTIR